MKRTSFILLGVYLTGCMTNNTLEYTSAADDNIYRLSRVELGMGEKDVIQIMHKPYSYESYQIGNNTYDVWFYVTKGTVLDQTRMVPQNLTPLTFKNGELVGRGYDYYNHIVKESSAPQASPEQKTEDLPSSQAPSDNKLKKPAEEDQAIEETLENDRENSHQSNPVTPFEKPIHEDQSLERALQDHHNEDVSDNDEIDSKTQNEVLKSRPNSNECPATDPQSEKKGDDQPEALDQKGEEIIDDAEEQNFNFW